MDYNPLMPSENKEEEIERKIKNENPFFIPSKSNQNNITIYGEKCCCISLIFFIIYFLFFIDFVSILVGNHNESIYNKKTFILLSVNITFFLIICFIFLYNYTFKLDIKKDEVRNQIIIVRKNYLCCKKIYKILLENAYFNCYENNKNNSCISINFSVLNIFKNSTELDLENCNIINVPIKLYYKFGHLAGNCEEINEKLKSCFPNNSYKNGIVDEIKKYQKKYMNKGTYIDNPKINGFLYEKMKISDLFYTFIFSGEKFKRIDIIYSKNFDKIFIGVVKNDKTYINRLILKINTIDKFAMSMEPKSFGFKVLLKETINQTEICDFIHQRKKYLEDFLFFLNGKLGDINEGNINNCETTSN